MSFRRVRTVLASAMITAVLAFALCGCGASDSREESQNATTVSTTHSATESADAEDATASSSPDESSAEISTDSETATEESSADSTVVSDENSADSDGTATDKVLVAYFSATGNTKQVAETIAEVTGGDVYEIVPADPYTAEDLDYNNDDCRANKEQNDSTARPEIAAAVQNMDEYSIVFIGHPIWWGIEPRIVDTFAESYDFSGKTVVNFCTSGGSGISSSTENLKVLIPGANWLDGRRFDSDASSDDVQAWLDELGIFE